MDSNLKRYLPVSNELRTKNGEPRLSLKWGGNLWRARWDLNPRSPAIFRLKQRPKADTLIRARLRALLHTRLLVYGAKGDAIVLFRLSMAYQSVFGLRYQETPSLSFSTNSKPFCIASRLCSLLLASNTVYSWSPKHCRASCA